MEDSPEIIQARPSPVGQRETVHTRCRTSVHADTAVSMALHSPSILLIIAAKGGAVASCSAFLPISTQESETRSVWSAGSHVVDPRELDQGSLIRLLTASKLMVSRRRAIVELLALTDRAKTDRDWSAPTRHWHRL